MLVSVFNTTTQILGSYLKFKGQNLGYLSPIILKANFGARSDTNFRGKFWGQVPRPPDMEVPLWGL